MKVSVFKPMVSLLHYKCNFLLHLSKLLSFKHDSVIKDPISVSDLYLGFGHLSDQCTEEQTF